MASSLNRLFKMPSPLDRLKSLNVRSDVAAVAGVMAASRRSELTAKQIGLYLPEAEIAVAMIEARYGKRRGIAVLTTRRLLFFGYEHADPPLTELLLTELRPAIVMAKGARFDALGFALDQALGRSAEIFAEAVVRELTQPSTPTRDPMELLTELRALHAAGVMTDVQYTAEKARLLDEL